MSDSGNLRVYLDHLTTSPCSQGASDAVIQAFSTFVGSYRSSNLYGRAALDFLELERKTLIELLGAGDVHICSSGSDANITAILSIGRAQRDRGKAHIISSRVEHVSVLRALRVLENEGSRVSWLGTSPMGRTDPGELKELVEDTTGLVIVQHSNPVSGIVQPVEEIASVTDAAGIPFHCDFCAGAGRVAIDLSGSGIDSLSISGHMAGGGSGAGALLMRRADSVPTSMCAGSVCPVNLAATAGMTFALEEAGQGIEAHARMVNELRSEFLAGLKRYDIGFDMVGEEKNLLPGAGLLKMEGPVPGNFHGVLEEAGIILPFPGSPGRLAFLREMGRDISEPEQYLGFCIAPANTIIDMEFLLRRISESMK
jgi:cysteine desulfurase